MVQTIDMHTINTLYQFILRVLCVLCTQILIECIQVEVLALHNYSTDDLLFFYALLSDETILNIIDMQALQAVIPPVFSSN